VGAPACAFVFTSLIISDLIPRVLSCVCLCVQCVLFILSLSVFLRVWLFVSVCVLNFGSVDSTQPYSLYISIPTYRRVFTELECLLYSDAIMQQTDVT